MRTIIRDLATVVATALLCSPPAVAQPRTAALTGTVVAADGARLPGVSLLVRGPETVVETSSGDAGQFRIAGLPPGSYEVTAGLEGFEPLRIGHVALAAGESKSLNLRLEVAALHESIRVVGEARGDSVEAFEMRESRARDVGEALAAVPGITKLRKGAIANDVVIRGFQGKDVTVLIDGQRLDGACPGRMDPPAFHVDFAEVSRVEVSKGPFDVKNQGGLAGIANIVTERPQRGVHGAANVTVATARTLATSASGSVRHDRWALLAGASTRRADPYEDGDGRPMTDSAGYRPTIEQDIRAYDAWSAWGRAALTPRDGTTLQLSYSRQSAGTVLYPYLQMDAAFDNATRTGARFEMATLPLGWRAFAAHVYYTRVDHWMTDELRTTSVGKPREYSMGTRAGTTVAGGRAEIQRGAVGIGAEASRRNWNTRTMLAMQNYLAQPALPDVDIDVAGAFATYARELSRGWRLETGARVDRATTSADPRLANTSLYLAYHGTATTRRTDVLPTAYAKARWRYGAWTGGIGAGHAARIADQQERFYALRRSGSDWVGNPTLSPSRNTGIDGNVRYTGGGIDAGVSAFVYRVDDFIRVINQQRTFSVPGMANAAARSYANVDALTRGFEANATVPLARSLFLSGDLSVVRGTARGSGAPDGDLPEMPPPRLTLRLRYDTGRWNVAAEGTGASGQDHVATDLGESPTPAFAVMSMRTGVRLRRFVVTAAVDNVFDTTYVEHLSYQRDPFRSAVRVHEPGRTWSMNIGARF